MLGTVTHHHFIDQLIKTLHHQSARIQKCHMKPLQSLILLITGAHETTLYQLADSPLIYMYHICCTDFTARERLLAVHNNTCRWHSGGNNPYIFSFYWRIMAGKTRKVAGNVASHWCFFTTLNIIIGGFHVMSSKF